MKKIYFIVLSLLCISLGNAQTSRFSYELGSNISYHANNGVWGLKINNGIEYQLSKSFSLLGTVGYSQSLVDWQNDCINGFSLFTADMDVNYKLFSTANGNSLNLAAGLTYFKGQEYNNVNKMVAGPETHKFLDDPGFNLKLRYKHTLNDRLSGSLNLEGYSYQNFFSSERALVLVNVGYSVYYRF